MDYIFEQTIPANTPKSNALSQERVLPAGVIKHVSITFPAGCHGLVHAVIYHDEHQVWPTLLDTTYHGEDIEITFTEEYKLDAGRNRFYVKFWNEDDTRAHTVTVRLTLREHEVEPRTLLERYPRLAQFLEALRGA